MPKKYLGGAEGAIDVECFSGTQEALGSVPFRAQKVGVASQTWSPCSLPRQRQTSRSSGSSRTTQELEASLGCVRLCL